MLKFSDKYEFALLKPESFTGFFWLTFTKPQCIFDFSLKGRKGFGWPDCTSSIKCIHYSFIHSGEINTGDVVQEQGTHLLPSASSHLPLQILLHSQMQSLELRHLHSLVHLSGISKPKDVRTRKKMILDSPNLGDRLHMCRGLDTAVASQNRRHCIERQALYWGQRAWALLPSQDFVCDSGHVLHPLFLILLRTSPRCGTIRCNNINKSILLKYFPSGL